MSEFPSDLRYRDSHEWVRVEGDGTVVVGISDHAQGELGDMVFVELPEPGMSYDDGKLMVHEENILITESGASLLSKRAAEELPVLN